LKSSEKGSRSVRTGNEGITERQWVNEGTAPAIQGGKPPQTTTCWGELTGRTGEEIEKSRCEIVVLEEAGKI